jgi:predicted O-methyltransferase YrrM
MPETTDPASPGTTFVHLRLVNSKPLASYLLNRPHLLNNWLWVNRPGAERKPTRLGRDEVVYHAWLPGFLVIDPAEAGCLRELIAGTAQPGTSPGHEGIAALIRELGWCADLPVDMDALLRRVRENFFAWQNPRELREFLALVAERRPKAVLEIGTSAGGLFYALSQFADPAALMVSLDTKGLPYGGGQTEVETELFRSFGPPGQRFEFIRNRSFLHASLRALEKILDGRKLDVLFIDADHSYGAVRSDFELYRRFVADDGLIALHDICDFPSSLEDWTYGNEAAIFWRELVGTYTTRAIVDSEPLLSPSSSEERYEMRWPALGIGVVFGNQPTRPAE